MTQVSSRLVLTSSRPLPPIAKLQLPTELDSLETLSAKLSAFLYVVRSNGSIAEATGHAVDESVSPAEVRAREEMSPDELMFYRAWKEGRHRLPEINWDTDKGHTPSDGRPLKKALRRAEAMNRLYETDEAKPEHYIWLTENHVIIIPLVRAIARIIGAERDQSWTSAKVSRKRNDLEILQSIVRISQSSLRRNEGGDVDQKVSRQIESLEGVVQRLSKEVSSAS